MLAKKLVTWGYALDCRLIGADCPTNRYYTTLTAYAVTYMGAKTGLGSLQGAWANSPAELWGAAYPLAIATLLMCLLLFVIGSISTGLPYATALLRMLMLAAVFAPLFAIAFILPYLGYAIVALSAIAYIITIFRQ